VVVRFGMPEPALRPAAVKRGRHTARNRNTVPPTLHWDPAGQAGGAAREVGIPNARHSE